MRTKYISHSLSANYSEPIAPVKTLPLVKKKGGRNYTLLGTSEKNYSLRERIWIGGCAFGKTSLSLGGALLSKNVRDDWKTCWNGKRSVAVYSSVNRHYKELSDNDKTALFSFFKGSKFKVEDFKEPINSILPADLSRDGLAAALTEPLLTFILRGNDSYKIILIPIFEKDPRGEWMPSVLFMLKDITSGMDDAWAALTQSSYVNGKVPGILMLNGSSLTPKMQSYQDLINGTIVTIDRSEYKIR